MSSDQGEFLPIKILDPGHRRIHGRHMSDYIPLENGCQYPLQDVGVAIYSFLTCAFNLTHDAFRLYRAVAITSQGHVIYHFRVVKTRTFLWRLHEILCLARAVGRVLVGFLSIRTVLER